MSSNSGYVSLCDECRKFEEVLSERVVCPECGADLVIRAVASFGGLQIRFDGTRFNLGPPQQHWAAELDAADRDESLDFLLFHGRFGAEKAALVGMVLAIAQNALACDGLQVGLMELREMILRRLLIG